MINIPKISNETYFKFSVVLLLFLLLTFDQDMSMIYILIMIGDFIWYKFDPKISFNLEKTSQNRWSSLPEVAIAGAVFFIISSVAVGFASATASNSFQSILTLLATSTPVLAGNKILTFIGWALIIPIIETSFFNGRLLEGLASFAEKRFGKNVPLNNFMNIRTFMVILVVAALFTLFHLTAKNLSSLPLLITFIFSVISSILVIRHQELKGAILLHILVNSLAIMQSMSLINF